MAKGARKSGVTGQNDAYLTEILLRKGYEMHGVRRHASSFNIDHIEYLCQDPHDSDVKIFMYQGNLTDATNLIRVI